MSLTLVYVPITSPATPNIIKKISFHNTYLQVPNLSGYNTQISMSAGKAKPSTDKHSAPNNEINRLSRGIATAKRTRKYIRIELSYPLR